MDNVSRLWYPLVIRLAADTTRMGEGMLGAGPSAAVPKALSKASMAKAKAAADLAAATAANGGIVPAKTADGKATLVEEMSLAEWSLYCDICFAVC